jgi:hypothetical protein
MRLHPMLAVILATALPIAGVADTPDVPPFAKELPQIKSRAPVLEFNGKDLTGFYTYIREHGYADPKKVFTVKDGLLRISGEQYGGVVTCGNYSDYHLIVEWKWGEATWKPREKNARDSGILLHCVGPDGAGGGPWMQSQECQIIEGGCGDLLMVKGKAKPSLTCETRVGPDGQLYFEKGGKSETRDAGRYNWWGRDPEWKDRLGFRGRRDVESPAGDWNRMEVLCDGDNITNIVNGYVVNVGTKSSLTEGKILIQSEGAEVFVRKFEVRPLVK